MSAMVSSALRWCLPSRASLHHAFPPHPLPTAAGAFRRSFQSGDGETMDEFEERLFGRKDTDEGSLYAKLDRAENAGRRYNMGSGMGGFSDRSRSGSSMGGFPGLSDSSSSGFPGFGASGDRSSSGFPGFGASGDRSSSGFPGFGASGDRSSSGMMGGFDSSHDGLRDKLDNAARNFQMEEDEDDDDDGDWEDNFEFRPDVQWRRGSTYKPRDLDLRRPAATNSAPRPQIETTTAEVLKKADFRNVRFLSKFLTEAGIIIKRSQTRISAKAQRKIAREIKTARAFGLMPFTTMGRRPFIFGRSAEEHYSEDEYFDFYKQNEPVEDKGDAEPNVEAV